jgi:hypothetical protein
MSTAQRHEATFASSFRRLTRPAVRFAGAGLVSAVSASLMFAAGAQAAAPPVGLARIVHELAWGECFGSRGW